MNTLYNSQNPVLYFPTPELNGWSPIAEMRAEGGARARPAPASPKYLSKRHRLSRLLDKLSVQIRNNNVYPPWPDMVDAPLDLSVRTEVKEERFSCGECGQSFGLQDRLAKHVASRHRGRTPDSARAYQCDVCQRRFARSDMLTRHARLHSGVKPYACAVCGQVFSRSDHLATHQRTHTGEKPYRCPECPYAACRRDMITRHMRTHTRRAPSAPPAPPAPPAV